MAIVPVKVFIVPFSRKILESKSSEFFFGTDNLLEEQMKGLERPGKQVVSGERYNGKEVFEKTTQSFTALARRGMPSSREGASLGPTPRGGYSLVCKMGLQY